MFCPMKEQTLSHDEIEWLQSALLRWFRDKRRSLPWRIERDWYKVFLSEFLLQQTQVSQALPYFEKFYRRFPSIHHLAEADEDTVLALWAGLGYYARARNMLKAAREIVQHFAGKFPRDYAQALSLPGIGPYTASAILSLAFDLPLPVIDGNVQRVITRLFGIADDLRQTRTLRRIRAICEKILPTKQPGAFNEALMELGAMVCTPTQPDCSHCPLNTWCTARKAQRVERIPFKSAAGRKQKRFHWVLVIRYRQNLLLVKRPASAMLGSMWEFPVISVESGKKLETLPRNLLTTLNAHIQNPIIFPEQTHIYSHIHLRYRAAALQAAKPFVFSSDFYEQQKWLAPQEIPRLALHSAHKKILQSEAFQMWWEKNTPKESADKDQ